MTLFPTENLTFTDVRHLPIVKQFAKRIGLVDTVDAIVDTQMELSPGVAVLAMVLDSLSGRSPLYRLKEFFCEQDTELLLGVDVPAERFCDHNLGRAMDKIYETGTQKIFSAIAKNAVDAFDIDTRKINFDTTSISVWGDYDMGSQPFDITYGYSKDKRPDLKQFLISMLCVDRSIPILGGPKDGNASDKSVNNEVLTGISKHMARYGLQPGAFVYVADSAFVTANNLAAADKHRVRFLSRLPATYNECDRVIEQAVAAADWIDIGAINETQDTKKRPAASYKAYDTTVCLHGVDYRAVVIHSSAHDKRRHKRIDRLLVTGKKRLEKACKKAVSTVYFCEPDARAAAEKLAADTAGTYHRIQWQVAAVDKFPRGRPAKDKPRKPIGREYHLRVNIEQDTKAIAPVRIKAGCFVLVSNLSDAKLIAQWPAPELLRLYKSQSGIERNFGFLKDPVIVNSIFLKRPHRIEALGLVLLIALLIWRLIERCLRQYIQRTGATITGWKDKPTKRPTAFMMTTKFIHILVVKSAGQRQLVKPLKPIHLEYLRALNVSPNVFSEP